MGQSLTPTMTWGSVAAATSYELQLAQNTNFAPTVYDLPGIGTTSQTVSPALAFNTTYYWRVNATNGGGTGAYSVFDSFTTAEDYATYWPNHKTIGFNTTASGANVSANVYNFPVLIRLNSSNYAGFSASGVGATGADIRFSKTVYSNALPFQIERWNNTADSAEIWVLLDTVLGNSLTQSIVMHSGNSSALIQSNPAAVFNDAGAHFRAVLHLNQGAGVKGSSGSGLFADATGNGNSGDDSVGTVPSAGVIGPGTTFGGGAYNAAQGAADYIAIQNKTSTNFNNAAKWSVSFWANLSSATGGGAIFYKGLPATWSSSDFEMTFGANADTKTSGLYPQLVSYAHGFAWTSSTALSINTWHHLVLTYGNAAGSGQWYIDGNPVSMSSSNNSYNSANAADVTTGSMWIGRAVNTTGDESNGYFTGSMDEFEISDTARSPSWVALAYQNQRPDQQMLLVMGPPAAVPTLSLPSNGAGHQSSTATTLSWNAVAGAGSYAVQVSALSGFTTTIFGQSGLTGLSAVVGGLAGGTTYYWEASASNAVGAGNWSSSWSFTTATSAPVLSSPANNASGLPLSLSLTWGSVNAAVSYGVQVSTDAAFGSTVYSQYGLSTTSQAVSGFSSGVTYYWEVNATSTTDTSAWSGAWSFAVSGMQVIPINAAWNMKSFNIVPLNDSATAVFNQGTGFLFVKDNVGNAYCPILGQNDIGIVQVGQGYQIYSSVPDTFSVQGVPVNYATTPIALSQGWNTIAYLPQTPDTIEHALAGVDSLIVLVKNNSGHTFWPALSIDGIYVMQVGEGYKVLMSANGSLTYPTPDTGVSSKRLAGHGGKPVLRLPDPRHYTPHGVTGNNATLLAKQVSVGGKLARDSSEVGAFDASGNLVGSGMVLKGITMVTVWGKNTRTKPKDGCLAGEPVVFKLWDGTREYPLEYESPEGSATKYAVDQVFLGALKVPDGWLITKFDLTRAYPNPFRGAVKIAFDVPTIAGISEHAIEINVYDLKGSLVKQLASGIFQAGHYTVAWNSDESHGAAVGSSVYILRMKASNFDKRLKLVRIQ
jgi:hypothetical protein